MSTEAIENGRVEEASDLLPPEGTFFDKRDCAFIAALLQNPSVCSIFTTVEMKAQAAEIQAKSTAPLVAKDG